MSKVVKQGPCSHCGSSDAYTEYDDGGAHCYSCKYHKRGGLLPYERKTVKDDQLIVLPDDVSYDYSNECVTWVSKYEINVSELIRHNVRWSQKKQQLLFIFGEMYGRDIGLIQARNFGNWSSRRYYNIGDVNRVFPLFSGPVASTTLVIVEDVISAIKVSRQFPCVPLLGSSMPLQKTLEAVRRGYNDIRVWLDSDKYGAALEIQERFQMIGVDANVILTDLDPKCYGNFFICDKIGELERAS